MGTPSSSVSMGASTSSSQPGSTALTATRCARASSPATVTAIAASREAQRTHLVPPKGLQPQLQGNTQQAGETVAMVSMSFTWKTTLLNTHPQSATLKAPTRPQAGMSSEMRAGPRPLPRSSVTIKTLKTVPRV
jgi:hypothetical protein